MEEVAGQAVHIGDVVVDTPELLAYERRVRVIRRQLDPRSVGHEWFSLARGARGKDPALVCDLDVEHRKEGLTGIRPVAPVRVLADIVPDREGDAELVIRLGAIGGV